MNYTWELLKEYGKYEFGFVDVYKTILKNRSAFVIINYLPQFEDKDQKVISTLLLEGEKNNWTEGQVKSILFDCQERIESVSNFKFRIFNKLEYMTTQIFYIKEIQNLEFGSSGDFTFQ